jgi:hypothetical protein
VTRSFQVILFNGKIITNLVLVFWFVLTRPSCHYKSIISNFAKRDKRNFQQLFAVCYMVYDDEPKSKLDIQKSADATKSRFKMQFKDIRYTAGGKKLTFILDSANFQKQTLAAAKSQFRE